MNEKSSFLKGKTAVITGAAGGIGEALCVRLARDFQMNLIITGRSESKTLALAERLRAFGVRVSACIGDLEELSFLDQIVSTARTDFGGADVLINNAGLSHNCTFDEMTPELFDSLMAVNVRAPYFLSQKLLSDLRRSDCATIINICSVVAHKGYPRQSAYAASKHALYGLSKSLAAEVYADNIRVHVICPGSVYTPMITMVRPELSPEGMIMPEDIADIAAFYLENRRSNAVIDEINVHRATKEPFL